MKHQWVVLNPECSAPLDEASADMEGRKRQETEGSGTQITNSMWGSSEVLSEHQSKSKFEEPLDMESNLSQPLLFSYKHNSSQLFLLSSEEANSLHSQAGAGLTPALWDLQKL